MTRNAESRLIPGSRRDDRPRPYEREDRRRRKTTKEEDQMIGNRRGVQYYKEPGLKVIAGAAKAEVCILLELPPLRPKVTRRCDSISEVDRDVGHFALVMGLLCNSKGINTLFCVKPYISYHYHHHTFLDLPLSFIEYFVSS